jgi:hypothetical protein
VFEKRVLRRIFFPKRDEITGAGENCIMRNFIICTLHQMYLEDEMGRVCRTHGSSMHTRFGEGQKAFYVDGRIILN